MKLSVQRTKDGLRLVLNSILSRFGFRLIAEKSIYPVSLIGIASTPLTPFRYQYLGNQNGVVDNLPAEKGRGLPLFDLSSNSYHPFIVAARALLNTDLSEKKHSLVFSLLNDYYKIVAPKTIEDIFQIEFNNKELYQNPPWCLIMPWSSYSLSKWTNHIKNTVLQENRVHNKSIGVEGGWAWFGPTHPTKAHIETKRLILLLSSIKTKGYQRNALPDGDIIGELLIRSENDWAWQANAAQHRACILSSLSYSHMPVRIVRTIRRSDVEFWPNVRNGLYTSSEALRIFDSILDQKFNTLLNNWEKYVDKNYLRGNDKFFCSE